MDKYENALMDLNVKWEDMYQYCKKQKCLYKFRNFKSKYWVDYIDGKLRMSTVDFFEDLEEINPHFSCKEILQNLEQCQQEGLLTFKFDIANYDIHKVCCEINRWVNLYRQQFRIGCFSSELFNNKIWKTHSDKERGFCIRYVVDKSELLKKLIYPVRYTNDTFSLCKSSIVVWLSCEQAKKEGKRMNVFWKEHKEIYDKLNKSCYIPIYLKKKEFSFENEYRMVLSNNEAVGDDMYSDNYLDVNGDIDLRSCVDAIFLGERFNRNKEYSSILNQIRKIIDQSDIKLYQMTKKCGKYEYVKI